MTGWRRRTEEWLSAEQHDDEIAADAAFVQVFQALPAPEAPREFVEQTVARAWAARTLRRRAVITVGIAASVVLAVAGAAAVALVFSGAARGALTTVAGFVTSSAVTLLSVAASGGEWWVSTSRTAGTLADLVAVPQAAAALLIIESIGLAALFTLRRLLHGEPQGRRGGIMCLI